MHEFQTSHASAMLHNFIFYPDFVHLKRCTIQLNILKTLIYYFLEEFQWNFRGGYN